MQELESKYTPSYTFTLRKCGDELVLCGSPAHLAFAIDVPDDEQARVTVDCWEYVGYILEQYSKRVLVMPCTCAMCKIASCCADCLVVRWTGMGCSDFALALEWFNESSYEEQVKAAAAILSKAKELKEIVGG